ncbi:hypothetical protein [Winogradskya consettensis]|nr:hypothetical protein [Actinoplanes consettensis]
MELVAVVLVVWLVIARSGRVRWPVAAALVLVGGAAWLGVRAFPLGTAEINLGSLVLAVVLVAAGREVERRTLGPGPRLRVVWPFRLLATASLLLVCCASSDWIRPAPFFPGSDVVLPLPSGLHATVEPHDGTDCGTGVCTAHLTVAGRPGQSPADLQAELRVHARTRGWTSDCRPAGWILTRGQECLSIDVTPTGAQITLEGSRN